MDILTTKQRNMYLQNMQNWYKIINQEGENIMSKYFKSKEELSNYINENFMHDSLEDLLTSQGPTDEEIIDALIADGYTDLDNLVEDGHAYQIGEYTNNGWLYEDEADFEYINDNGIQRKLKKR